MLKLPLNRINPKGNESLFSFLHRLALANYYEHLGSMFTEIKSAAYAENCNEIHPNLFWVDFVHDLLQNMGIDINELVVNKFDELLVRRACGSNQRRHNHRPHYHRYSTKFCPNCLNEDFYHRLHWDVSYITTCSKHKKDLITKCTKCGKVIRLSRLMRNECHCGKNYTAMKAKEVDAISMEAQSIFQEFLLSDRKKVLRKDGKWLSKEDYFDLFYIFSQLIRGIESNRFVLSKHFRIKGDITMTGLGKREINLDQFKYIVNTLHLLVLTPLEDFTSLIDAISLLDEGLSYESKSKYNKYKYINNIFKHPKGSYYYKIYTEYLNNKTDEYVNRRFALPPMVSETKYLPIYKAMKLLKTKYNTLMNLCENNLIRLHETQKNGKIIRLIERESILEYQQMKENHFTLEQATIYLGSNFKHMKELLVQKLIIATHGPSVDGYDLWYIPKAEVFRFKKELYDKFLPITSAKGTEGFSIQQASSKLRRDKVTVGEIYQMILNGRLRVYHNGNSSLIDGIKILDVDVRVLARELYYKRINDKGYLGKEIQRVCMIGPEKLRQLLENQVLKIDFVLTDGKHPPRKYIKKEQIVDYLKKYKGMSDHSISKHLVEIETLFEPTI
ncbi:TniQ family protein [Lysinibacillus xylanilyticus]|uniref:TniQ family protein n=1 Tax=Lysinibacillus xylanilyticus TaxID=582475 RepID=A0ABV3VYF9_9BACI